jgi:hypothetical protein
MSRYPRSRTARHMAWDQEGLAELKKILDDGEDIDLGDLLAALIEGAPEDKQEQVHTAVREMGQDARGPRSWARDRLERRRYAKDLGPGPAMEPAGRPVEEFRREDRPNENMRGANDARRLAMDARGRHDSAFRSFRARYPGAANIESGGF